jgi:phosphorylcholine metabolism protein LicD
MKTYILLEFIISCFFIYNYINIKKLFTVSELIKSNALEIEEFSLKHYHNIKQMNYLLQDVVRVLNDNNIPYYLDCGTLLGSIRENQIMKHDTDVDVTVHLSMWNNLDKIDFSKYGLERTRTIKNYPNKKDGNMISVKMDSVNPDYTDVYCDIYTNPAFPLLTETKMNGKTYTIPKEPKLYLTQLYGKDWNIPSDKHADTLYHRGCGLVNSEYSKHWDKKYKIYKCIS